MNDDAVNTHVTTRLNLPDTSPLRTLEVFTDDPLFTGSEDDVRSDVFHHHAFAETLYKLIKSNAPPLSVGLFGSWGIGKSSIVNILFRMLNDRDKGAFRTIYFNAWKYSGDSFRRQFLIEVATQIHGRESKAVTRLEQLNYVDVLKQSRHQNLLASLTQAIKEATALRFSLKSSAVARFLLGCLSLIISALIAAVVSRFSPWVSALILSTTAPAVFVWFSRIKFDELFVFQEAPLYDPKLIFPEQFESEFANLVSSEALNGQKVVIAIDDLDRCEPKIVQDILVSMKNFTGHKNCFFIVPCDDKTIVGIFTEPAQQLGYKDESLRKYFNVGIRIPPITSTDLVDFANTMARKTGLPLDVVQVAVLANCRDARKMKHFLNGFVLKYQIAKAREKARLMPQIVDDNLLELAKTVLIEDAFPELFARIVANPRVYQVIEAAALTSFDNKAELESLKLEKWETDFVGLLEILRRTRYIPMPHAEVFFSLKSTNQEAKVPRGTELREAVIAGDEKIIDGVVAEINDTVAKTAVADLLVDLISRSKETFLQHSISGALRICFISKLLASDDTKRVASAITNAFLFEKVPVLAQQPELVLDCAEAAGKTSLILQKFDDEASQYRLPTPPGNVNALIASLYRFKETRGRFASIFNRLYESWVEFGGDALNTLSSLRLPDDCSAEDKIPSNKVLARVLEGLKPDASQLHDDTVRRSILFASWSDEFAPSFLKVLSAFTQGSPAGTEYGPKLEFVIQSVLLKPELVDYPDAVQLWSPLPSFYNGITDTRGKREISRVITIFASLANDANVRAQAKNEILRIWQTFDDATLRDNLGFLKAIASPEAQALGQNAIEQEYATAKNEREAPTDRTAQRVALCLDFSDWLVSKSTGDLLIDALQASKDESFSAWREIINLHQDRLGIAFQVKLAEKCLELAQLGRYSQNRQEALLQMLTNTIARLPQERRREVTQKYFALLKSSDQGIRSAAAAALGHAKSSTSNDQEFRIQIGAILGDLRRDLSTQELLPRRAVIEALVNQGDVFTTAEWREVADIGKRLLSQPEINNQEFGMYLIERIPGFSAATDGDVVRVLIGLEKSDSSLKDRASRKLDALKTGEDGLAESTRQALGERVPEGDDTAI